MADDTDAQEPTMEEILASIRKIISEDDEESPEGGAEMADALADVDAAVKAESIDEIETEDEDILELTDPLPDEDSLSASEENAKPASWEPTVTMDTDEKDEVTFSDSQPPQLSGGDGLLSQGAEASASAAFGALASNLVTSTGDYRTLEDVVSNLLKPMLSEWLDINLPPMVEQLVREEIERVARRRP